MVQSPPKTEPVHDCPHVPDDSNAAYLRARACATSLRVRDTWAQLGLALRNASDPRKLVRYHPIGTTVAVGVIAAIGARRLVKPSEPKRPSGFFTDALRSLGSTLLRSVISQTIVAAIAAPAESTQDASATSEDFES